MGGGLGDPPPLEDFAYVVNSDVRGGALLHKAPLEPRPMPMYEREQDVSTEFSTALV